MKPTTGYPTGPIGGPIRGIYGDSGEPGLPGLGDSVKSSHYLAPELEIGSEHLEDSGNGSEEEHEETEGPNGAHIKILGKEVENYKAALESLGHSTDLDEFTIDSRGDSPELREKLGEDYLDNRVIIVSEKQLKELSLMPGNPNYMGEVISEISKDLIKKITPYEALVGKVNLLYDSKSITGIFDPSFRGETPSHTEGLCVTLVLDTLTEAVKKMEALNNKIGLINETSLKELDKDLLENILNEIHPLTTKYGSIEPIKDLNTTVHMPIKEGILYFRHKGYDIFLFNNEELFLVYHGKKIRSKASQVKTLHSSNKSEIIDLLVKNEFLNIERENLSNHLEATARTVLKEKAPNLAGFQFYKAFKQFKDNPGIVERLKEENWYLLRDLCYDKVEFTSLPLEVKELVTKPRDDFVDKYLRLLNEKIVK